MNNIAQTNSTFWIGLKYDSSLCTTQNRKHACLPIKTILDIPVTWRPRWNPPTGTDFYSSLKNPPRTARKITNYKYMSVQHLRAPLQCEVGQKMVGSSHAIACSNRRYPSRHVASPAAGPRKSRIVSKVLKLTWIAPRKTQGETSLPQSTSEVAGNVFRDIFICIILMKA